MFPKHVVRFRRSTKMCCARQSPFVVDASLAQHRSADEYYDGLHGASPKNTASSNDAERRRPAVAGGWRLF
jgi:hypothetical protein